jgi:hypothetical protein
MPSVTYVAEYKNSFADANWVALVTTIGASGNVAVPDSTAASRPMRLYRLRAQ